MFSKAIEAWHDADGITKTFTALFGGFIIVTLLALVATVVKNGVNETRWTLSSNEQRLQMEINMEATYEVCMKMNSGSECHGYLYDLKWIKVKNAGLKD